MLTDIQAAHQELLPLQAVVRAVRGGHCDGVLLCAGDGNRAVPPTLRHSAGPAGHPPQVLRLLVPLLLDPLHRLCSHPAPTDPGPLPPYRGMSASQQRRFRASSVCCRLRTWCGCAAGRSCPPTPTPPLSSPGRTPSWRPTAASPARTAAWWRVGQQSAAQTTGWPHLCTVHVVKLGGGYPPNHK